MKFSNLTSFPKSIWPVKTSAEKTSQRINNCYVRIRQIYIKTCIICYGPNYVIIHCGYNEILKPKQSYYMSWYISVYFNNSYYLIRWEVFWRGFYRPNGFRKTGKVWKKLQYHIYVSFNIIASFFMYIYYI